MRSQHIRALTGVRFFAALWVVVYHCTRHNAILLANNHPEIRELTYPITSAGVRGVDLFFMLSGFVLALNYMDRLGGRLEVRPTLRFLWLRLARIWPLYMLVIVGAGLLRIIRHDLWDSAGTNPITWTNLLRQALMVQQWFPPERGPTSWVGPAWSLSAEWLAYLMFPVLVLLVARFHRRMRARTLLVLAGLTMVPLVVGIVVQGNMGGNVWILRILCEFTTGMLLCAAASRLRLTPRVRRVAGVGAWLSVAAVVAWLYAVRTPRWRVLAERVGRGPVRAVDLLPGHRHRITAQRAGQSRTRPRWWSLLRALPGAQPDAQPVPRRHGVHRGLLPRAADAGVRRADVHPGDGAGGVLPLPLLRGAGAQADAGDAGHPVQSRARPRPGPAGGRPAGGPGRDLARSLASLPA